MHTKSFYIFLKALFMLTLAGIAEAQKLPAFSDGASVVYMNTFNYIEIDQAGKDIEDLDLEADIGRVEKENSYFSYYLPSNATWPLEGRDNANVERGDSVHFRLYLLKGASRILVDMRTFTVRGRPYEILKSGFADRDTLFAADLAAWAGPFMDYENGFSDNMKAAIHEFEWVTYNPATSETIAYSCRDASLREEILKRTLKLPAGSRIWLTKVSIRYLNGKIIPYGSDFGWTKGD